MITPRDKTFCASSGTCVNHDCLRWLDFGQKYELPVSLAELKDGEHCPGYEQHQALALLERVMK